MAAPDKISEAASCQAALKPKKEGERYGLVLGGGGSKGCYHVGVWQAMNEEGISFDAVSGTSIGALVGIFYPGNNIEPVTDFVMNMEPENIAQDLPHLPVTLKQKVQGTRSILQFVIRYFDSKMDITPLRRHFQAMFDYSSFVSSPVKYACMTFNDTKKEPRPFFKREITAENAETIVMASSACYPAFPKVRYQGDEYTDGMFADNVPIELLHRILPDSSWTVVVDLHDPGDPQPPALKEEMFYIQPLLQLGSPLDFSRQHAEKLYAQGYLETKKYLGQYPGYVYTFTENDRPFIQIVEDYLARQITQMHIVLPKLDNLPERAFQAVLGYVPPALPGSREPYEFGMLVEALALSAKVNPVALYDYREFLRLLLDRLESASALQATPEEFRLVSVLSNMKREEVPNLLFRILKQNHGHFPEKVESVKDWFPVSYTLAVIRYCLDLLCEQLGPSGAEAVDPEKETPDSKQTPVAQTGLEKKLARSKTGLPADPSPLKAPDAGSDEEVCSPSPKRAENSQALCQASARLDHQQRQPLSLDLPSHSEEEAKKLLEAGLEPPAFAPLHDHPGSDFLPALPVLPSVPLHTGAESGEQNDRPEKTSNKKEELSTQHAQK